MVCDVKQSVDADAFDQECDKHCVLATDMVRNPAEEWTANPIDRPVDRQGETECRKGQSQDGDWYVCDLVVAGNGRKLCDGHQSAGAYHHEHRVHHPEHGRSYGLVPLV